MGKMVDIMAIMNFKYKYKYDIKSFDEVKEEVFNWSKLSYTDKCKQYRLHGCETFLIPKKTVSERKNNTKFKRYFYEITDDCGYSEYIVSKYDAKYVYEWYKKEMFGNDEENEMEDYKIYSLNPATLILYPIKGVIDKEVLPVNEVKSEGQICIFEGELNQLMTCEKAASIDFTENSDTLILGATEC